MLYTELLRVAVFVVGGVATALGAVSAISIQRSAESAPLYLAAVWWILATLAGLWLGDADRSAEAVRRPLAAARTANNLPADSASRIALRRLWPIAVFTAACGGLAWIWPQIAVIGAGFAILMALSWRGREGAVQAIEDRDGVSFYVEPAHAWQPLKLTRTPGLYRDRPPTPKPPPPPRE